jgi:hypothetical protein
MLRIREYDPRHSVSTLHQMMAWVVFPIQCVAIFMEDMTSPHMFSSMTIGIFFSRPVDLMGDFSTFLRSTPLMKVATQNFKAFLRHLLQVIPTANSRASTCQDQAHPFSQNHPPGTLLPRNFSRNHPPGALLPRERAVKVHARANPVNRNGTAVLIASKHSTIRIMYSATLPPSTRTSWTDFSLSIVIVQHANTACSDVAKAVLTAGHAETTSSGTWRLICQKTCEGTGKTNESNWSTEFSTRRILI